MYQILLNLDKPCQSKDIKGAESTTLGFESPQKPGVNRVKELEADNLKEIKEYQAESKIKVSYKKTCITLLHGINKSSYFDGGK